MNLLYRAKGDVVEGIVLLKTAQVRISSTGSRFLDVTLVDATGEMNGKLWNWGDAPPPDAGGPARVKGMVSEYMGKLQMRVDRLVPATDEEVDWAALVPSAPEDPQAMYDELLRTARAFSDKDLAALAEYMLQGAKEKLLYWPAAVSYHHAERAGLLYHTLSIVRAARALLPLYTFLDADLLLCGAMLHDLSKIGELAAQEYGLADSYSKEGMLIGHIVAGVESIARASAQLGIPDEKALLVRHMILSHHSEPDYGSPRRPMIPEAELLHHLDNVDARMYEMRHALAAVQPGEFSAPVRSMENRKLYRKKIEDVGEK